MNYLRDKLRNALNEMEADFPLMAFDTGFGALRFEMTEKSGRLSALTGTVSVIEADPLTR
ncbi:MAG: hypothetical protein GY862_30490 [Gammaproteobacteria bacterium]|nr:hypothetical protein [Gammaproteobacteria bacterium]